MSDWISMTPAAAWVIAAARDYGKLLADPNHAYSDELDAEENLMSAIKALIEEDNNVS